MTSTDRKVSEAEFHEARERLRRWSRWGADDDLGATNLCDASSVLSAVRLVSSGKTFSLGLPIVDGGFGPKSELRKTPHYAMTRDGSYVEERRVDQNPGGFCWTDDYLEMPVQTGSHWDALSHVFYDGHMYNGFGSDAIKPDGARKGSITRVADRMIGRGVLLDVPALDGRDHLDIGEAIEAEDLDACCERQGVEVRRGDFVLVRTGRLGLAQRTGEWGSEWGGGPTAGLGFSTIEWFLDRDVVGVSSDTFCVEILPSQTPTPETRSPMHVILVQGAGVHLGEFWCLDELAADCREDGRYEFLLVAAPMLIEGAVGAPTNPIALK